MIGRLVAAAFLTMAAAAPALAQSFEEERALAQALVDEKMAELNTELAKRWGVDGPVAFAEIEIVFPSNDQYPNPFPVDWQPEEAEPRAFFMAASTSSRPPRTIVLPNASARCRPSQPPSYFARWALGYLWQCEQPGWFQWDFYGFTGYSHSMLFYK